MFKKILIAGRGEIVLRVIKTCREKFNPPIVTVAIYSEADKNMPYVKAADEAYYVGPSEAVYSYLNMWKILEAASRSGADAIHPTYQFLAENDLFVTACERRGIKFIGPSSRAMESVSDKIKTLKIARRAKVPTLEQIEWNLNGSLNPKSINKRLRTIEKRVGYPLIVKPKGGGGGIGMQIVYSRPELMPAIQACSFQAKSVFKNPEVYIERYLPEDAEPSHIEVQILADEDRILHLFERDCSIQRRNQKIVEEAPSEKLDEDLRKRIYKCAREIIKRIKKESGVPYEGAGTLEFLVDKDKNIYFMEMNKRLQVEHGVTELLTGIDIVEWQIRIAAGEKLPFKQRKVRFEGHAIEARIYPELWDESSKLFVPQGEAIKLASLPRNENIRIDSALSVGEGYEIPIYYEGLIMKVISWGSTREEAIKTLFDGLDQVNIHGAKTNIDFLMGVIMSQRFKCNEHTIKMLEDRDALFQIEREARAADNWRLTRSLQRNIGILG